MKKLITLALALGMGGFAMAQMSINNSETFLIDDQTTTISSTGYLDYADMDDDEDDKRRRRRRRSKGGKKGMHWGLHFTPGLGSPGLPSGDDGFVIGTLPSFSYQFGGDFYYYFNDHIGIKSGLELMNLSASMDFAGISNNASVMSLGIPLKLTIATHQKFGFLFESGLGFYFPLSGKVELDGESGDDPELKGMVTAWNFLFGGHYSINEKVSLSLGYSYNLSFSSFFEADDALPINPAYNWGINLGMSMKLQ